MKRVMRTPPRKARAKKTARGKLAQIIRSAGEDAPRAGWEEQIRKALLEFGEDVDEDWLNAPLSTSFDEKEWTW
jgi:hypothetical protein